MKKFQTQFEFQSVNMFFKEIIIMVVVALAMAEHPDSRVVDPRNAVKGNQKNNRDLEEATVFPDYAEDIWGLPESREEHRRLKSESDIPVNLDSRVLEPWNAVIGNQKNNRDLEEATVFPDYAEDIWGLPESREENRRVKSEVPSNFDSHHHEPRHREPRHAVMDNQKNHRFIDAVPETVWPDEDTMKPAFGGRIGDQDLNAEDLNSGEGNRDIGRVHRRLELQTEMPAKFDSRGLYAVIGNQKIYRFADAVPVEDDFGDEELSPEDIKAGRNYHKPELPAL